MTTVSSEPATKADVKEAIDELRRTDLAEIRAEMATKLDVKEAIDELRRTDLAAIRAELAALHRSDLEIRADIATIRAEMATKQHLEAWGHALLAEMRQQINSNTESIRDWIKVLQEQTAAFTGAANANISTLRAELEAHRDDPHVHRAPRRRRS